MRAQVDDFAGDPLAREGLGRFQRAMHELARRHDRDVGALADDLGDAEGHEMLSHRHFALAGEERLRLQHDDGVRPAQRRLHQALGVGRIGRHADDQARNVRPHRMITCRCGAGRRSEARLTPTRKTTGAFICPLLM